MAKVRQLSSEEPGELLRYGDRRKDDLRTGPGAQTSKQPQKHIETCKVSLVLDSSFFKAAFQEVKLAQANGGVEPLFGEKSIGLVHKNFCSPLGNFLTGAQNKHPWVQLAGHKDSFVPGRNGTIIKKASTIEQSFYEDLSHDCKMAQMAPLLIVTGNFANGDPYVEMQDLLCNFDNPSVLDIKMGTRTFLESECGKAEKRKDLLEKLVALDPKEPTPEEYAEGITKLRYMAYREAQSSSHSLGVRLEGFKIASEPPVDNFKKANSVEQVRKHLKRFFPEDLGPKRDIIFGKFLARLLKMRKTMDESKLFKEYEVIGSSLLFIYDRSEKCNTGIWMIDFGKTTKSPVGNLNHRSEWVFGNHEDGYLWGFDHLIKIFEMGLA